MNSKNLKFAALLLIALCAPTANAFAESSDDDGDAVAIDETVEAGMPLPDVVVTANRRVEPADEVTYPIVVVTQEDIEQQGAQSAIDALSNVPGVYVTSSGSPGDDNDIRLMGSDRDEVLVLVDGVPINTVVDNRPNILATIPAENIARIEIIEGAHSGMYGSRAVGGVINIITKEGREGFAADLGFKAGNLGRFIEETGISLGKGNHNLRINYQRWDQAGRFSNDRLGQNAATINWRYHFSDELSLQMSPQYYNTNQQLAFDSIWDVQNGTVYYPRDRDRKMRRDTVILPFSLILNKVPWWELYFDYSYYYQFLRIENPPSSDFPPAPFPGDQYVRSHEDRHRFNLRNVFTPLDQSGFRDIVTVGFDIDVEHLSFVNGPYAGPRQEFPIPNQKFDRENYAIFVQNAFYLKEYLAIVGGFRFDRNTMFGDEVTARASIMGKIPQSNTTIKLSYSETFNAPLITLFVLGLQPQKETAQNYSAGIEQWITKKFFLSSFFFYKDYDNYFSDASDPVGTSDAYAMGVESMVKIFPVKWMTFQGSYSWTKAEDEVRKVPLPLRPEHMVKTALTFTPIEGLTLRSDLKYVGKRYWGTNTGLRYVDWQGRVSDGTLDPYVKWDLTGRYSFKIKNKVVRELTFFTTVENVLNQDYEEEYGRPMPGINFLSGFSGKFF